MGIEVRAECLGYDLYPSLQERSPKVYTALEDYARSIPFGQGTLFRLEHEGKPPSFIFGSLHLTDRRATAFSNVFLEGLSQSKILALETIETGNVLRRSAKIRKLCVMPCLLSRSKSLMSCWRRQILRLWKSFWGR
jgi:uncharacterized protein YbaP (TraB family)